MRAIFACVALLAGLWVAIVPAWMIALDGVETVATVTQTDANKPYAIVYEFEAGGRKIEGRQGMGDKISASAMVGNEIPVTYSARFPRHSLAGSKREHGWVGPACFTFLYFGMVVTGSWLLDALALRRVVSRD